MVGATRWAGWSQMLLLPPAQWVGGYPSSTLCPKVMDANVGHSCTGPHRYPPAPQGHPAPQPQPQPPAVAGDRLTGREEASPPQSRVDLSHMED